jgi:flagellar biosynthesis protein FlhF
MIIRKIFPSLDIVEIYEELRKIYGDNFIIIEVNTVKKRPIPFLPFFGKEYKEVIIEIAEKPQKKSKKETKLNEEKGFKEQVEEELFLKELEELKKQIAELKSLLEKNKIRKVNISYGKKKLKKEEEKFLEQLGDEALQLFDVLLEKGVEEKIAIEILKKCTGFDIENQVFDLKEQPPQALAGAFEEMFKFQNLENYEEQKVIALVGPTGVGKTTTIAKIVSNLVLNQQKTLGVISLDTFRVGGAQRLESFLKVLEVPFRKADTKKAFELALEDFSDKDFIFIDIAGRSVYDELSWKEIFSILSIIEKEKFLSLLTVSFNMSFSAIMEIYEHIKKYKVDGFIFTKADETLKRGVIINVLANINDIPLYYITNGQKVPHNIMNATPSNLAKILLE